ncbi:methylated-DNA--[protein]-cysteine S-methyltransferase [Microcella humidisoli]|uniref:Methylated-DNA--protein-cysteine methyltransferase n=1 Tax=Microcella humidisoli TaxID=2963406 RepID=A0ABY5FWI0_9MICO|nr:methylated-DNA--[protein]-cysteine S-methyltransferase [Microcella humidisoli]UTT62648.1 methylated-DNA--[protein]-cysteine S-methyltransferase [Microcella humidisoli]
MTTPTAPPVGLLTIDSPLGRIALQGDAQAVTRLEIATGGHLSTEGVPDAPTPVLRQAAAELAEYFSGRRTAFDVPVRVHGTPFQQAIWQQLREIPFGAVRGYGELGRATGRPTAGRAVGGAVGANPVPLLIPCHRVLASDARITGYSAGDGIPTKVWLLDHEGIAHR